MKKLLLCLVILLSLLFGAIMILVSTEAGLKGVFSGVRKVVPGRVSVTSLTGRIIGPIHIQNFRYETPDLSVTLNDFFVEWKPAKILERVLYIEELKARGLTVRRHKTGTSSSVRKEPGEAMIPLSVVVQKALISDISMVSDPDQLPREIHQISMRAEMGPEALHIQELAMEAPLFSATLTGQVKPTKNLPMDLTLEWGAQPRGIFPLKGRGRFEGTLKKLDLTHELEAPVNVQVKGTVTDVVSNLRWDAILSAEQLNTAEINSSWPQVQMAAEIKSQGGLSQFQTEGSLEISESPYGKLSGNIALTKTDEAWRADQVRFIIPGTTSRLEAQGDYRSDQSGGRVQIQGDWTDLSWPLVPQAPVVTSAKGRFMAKGSPQDYLLELNGRAKGKQIPETDWVFKGTGSLDQLSSLWFQAGMIDGELKGEGSVSWKPSVRWDLSMSGTDLNPGLLHKEWPGSLAVAMSSSGRVEGGSPAFSVDIENLSGTLRGVPLGLQSGLAVIGDRYTLSDLELVSGPGRMTASGSLAPSWDLKWQIHAADLSNLSGLAKGEMTGQGSLRGPGRAPRIIAQLQARHASFKDYRAEELDLEMDIDLADRLDSHFDLRSQDIFAGARTMEALVLQCKGKVSDHHMILNFTSPTESVDIGLQGSFRRKVWQGSLHQVDIASEQLGIWELEKQGPFSVSQEVSQIGEWCWVQRPARTCLSASWEKIKGSRATLEVTDIPLSDFKAVLPVSTTLEGALHAQAELAMSPLKKLTGDVRVHVSPASVSYITSEQEPVLIQFRQAGMNARLDRQGLNATVGVSLEDQSELQGRIELPGFVLPDFSKQSQKLGGFLKTDLKMLNLIPAFTNVIENAEGRLKSDLSFGGTLGSPLVTGEVAIEEAAMDLTRTGTRIENMGLTLRSRDKKTLMIQGSATSGEGNLRVEGEIGLQPHEGWPTKLLFKGEKFEALNIPEARVLISPDLSLEVKHPRIDVAGELMIPLAALEPRDFSAAVPVSKDIVIMDEATQAKPEDKWKIYSKVKVVLGDQVSFDGFGLRGTLGGDLTATDEPGKITTGLGELQIQLGKYQAYGQKLKIERGRFIFANGPIDDPGLDVRASRQTGDVIAGVDVRGTLKDPQLELFSLPSMDQGDALSYLLFGRPMQQASSEEGELLYAAALSVGMSGGSMLANRIGSTFGLEPIEIEEGTSSEGALLVIGKYLSPRLYVGYGIGLFEPVSTLRTRYQLTKRWLVQTELGVISGADLLYKIER